MSFIAFVLMGVAMIATLAIVFTGIISMAKGGEFNQKWSNKLMRARVLMQMIALTLFAVGMLLLKAGK